MYIMKEYFGKHRLWVSLKHLFTYQQMNDILHWFNWMILSSKRLPIGILPFVEGLCFRLHYFHDFFACFGTVFRASLYCDQLQQRALIHELSAIFLLTAAITILWIIPTKLNIPISHNFYIISKMQRTCITLSIFESAFSSLSPIKIDCCSYHNSIMF